MTKQIDSRDSAIFQIEKVSEFELFILYLYLIKYLFKFELFMLHFFRDGITPFPLHEITEIQMFRKEGERGGGTSLTRQHPGSHDLIQAMYPQQNESFKLPGFPGVIRSLTTRYYTKE